MSPANEGAGGLEGELDALYTAPLDQFVASRDALAKRLRGAGAADESRRIKALRKPSVVAWAINRLHLEKNGLADIAAASEALRAALQNPRSADERRVAIEARRKALEGATSAVVSLVEAAGSSASPALLRRIERTVLAVSTGAVGGSESPVPGRLDQELEPPGFEAIFEAPAPTVPATRTPAAHTPAKTSDARTAPPATASAPGKAASPPAKKAEPSKAAPEAKPTPAPRGNVRDFKKEAALRKAQAALDQADGDLERATDQVEAGRMRVTDAEKALVAARKEVEAARRELAAVRSKRDEARRELDRAKKEQNS